MFEERKFQISLLISFFIHSFLLFCLPSFQSLKLPKAITPLEVTYHKLEEQILEDKIISKSPPPFIDTDNIIDFKRKIQKEPISIEKISFEKKITLPEIPSPNITSPAYLNYYQKVREKIKISAYRNYTQPDVGEVYLSFCLSSDGRLKRLNLGEKKSCASEYLKRIALKSIQDAQPFPAFSKDLEFPELSFNVIISFEVE